MNRHAISSILAVLVVLALPGAVHSSVGFSDTEFNDADWELTVLEFATGGTSSSTQEITGGNPGSYREITNVTNATGSVQGHVIGFYRNLNAIYNPQSQGAIGAIEYSEDAKWIWSELPGGDGHRTGPAFRQDGIIYVCVQRLVVPETSWVDKSLSGLGEEDFAPPEDIINDIADPRHPDFLEEGSTIELGFYRWNTRPANKPTPRTHIVGIDNWIITVHELPTVPTYSKLSVIALTTLLLILGVLAFRWSCRRRHASLHP